MKKLILAVAFIMAPVFAGAAAPTDTPTQTPTRTRTPVPRVSPNPDPQGLLQDSTFRNWTGQWARMNGTPTRTFTPTKTPTIHPSSTPMGMNQFTPTMTPTPDYNSVGIKAGVDSLVNTLTAAFRPTPAAFGMVLYDSNGNPITFNAGRMPVYGNIVGETWTVQITPDTFTAVPVTLSRIYQFHEGYVTYSGFGGTVTVSVNIKVPNSTYSYNVGNVTSNFGGIRAQNYGTSIITGTLGTSITPTPGAACSIVGYSWNGP